MRYVPIALLLNHSIFTKQTAHADLLTSKWHGLLRLPASVANFLYFNATVRQNFFSKIDMGRRRILDRSAIQGVI